MAWRTKLWMHVADGGRAWVWGWLIHYVYHYLFFIIFAVFSHSHCLIVRCRLNNFARVNVCVRVRVSVCENAWEGRRFRASSRSPPPTSTTEEKKTRPPPLHTRYPLAVPEGRETARGFAHACLHTRRARAQQSVDRLKGTRDRDGAPAKERDRMRQSYAHAPVLTFVVIRSARYPSDL